jgi:hypothetical protein
LWFLTSAGEVVGERTLDKDRNDDDDRAGEWI